MAESAAEVGSFDGIETLAWLMEQTNQFARAAKLYEQAADRYDHQQFVIAFYYRMARVRGDKTYESALAARLPALFPQGLQRADAAAITAKPARAVEVLTHSDLARAADIRPHDLIVALDGWRTDTMAQYETVRAFQEDGDLNLLIWRDGLIQRQAHGKKRMLGIDLRDFPSTGQSD